MPIGCRYEIAKEQGDFAEALAFHEKILRPDKGYLIVRVSGLAFQKARTEHGQQLQMDCFERTESRVEGSGSSPQGVEETGCI